MPPLPVRALPSAAFPRAQIRRLTLITRWRPLPTRSLSAVRDHCRSVPQTVSSSHCCQRGCAQLKQRHSPANRHFPILPKQQLASPHMQRDTFDEVATAKGDPARAIITTWHEAEPLLDALWFAMFTRSRTQRSQRTAVRSWLYQSALESSHPKFGRPWPTRKHSRRTSFGRGKRRCRTRGLQQTRTSLRSALAAESRDVRQS
jgi:hypothetical protein